MEEQKVKFILNNSPLLSSLVYIQIFFSFAFFFPSSFPFSLLSFSLSFLPLSLPTPLPLYSFFFIYPQYNHCLYFYCGKIYTA